MPPKSSPGDIRWGMAHRPSVEPVAEGQIAGCAACGALFLAADRDGVLRWIPLRWWLRYRPS